MRITVPYLKLRDGRPRWEPGPALRAAGFKGRDLRDEGGGWLDQARAIERATELNREVAAWREAGAPRRRPTIPRHNPRSIDALWDAYQQSVEHAELAAHTRRDYASKMQVFRAVFGTYDVMTLQHHHIYQWWQQVHATRGHAMANGCLAVARRVMSHARRIGWRQDNPARTMHVPSVPPRCVVWTASELAALVDIADGLLLPSVADAVVIALHTGQRQGDVLALELGRVEGGRAVFRISKTGARVAVPFTPALEQRLALIRARRAAGDVVDLTAARRVILDERGQPYTASSFGKAWRPVRDELARTMPDVADKLFLDLRDTAITRLALAGCTIAEIRAITGHSMQTIHAVLAHYLALDERMAGTAIERLRAWMQDEGIAI